MVTSPAAHAGAAPVAAETELHAAAPSRAKHCVLQLAQDPYNIANSHIAYFAGSLSTS